MARTDTGRKIVRMPTHPQEEEGVEDPREGEVVAPNPQVTLPPRGQYPVADVSDWWPEEGEDDSQY